MDNNQESGTSETCRTAHDDFEIKGAAARAHKRDHAEPDCCTICLDPITERAVTSPCNHLSFDFICLVQWLQTHSSCPLCKANVNEVQYDWRGPADFKTFHVAHAQAQEAAETALRVGNRPREATRARRSSRIIPPSPEDLSLTRRREVYDLRLFSLHVGSNRHSGYRDITPAQLGVSAELQSRARAFLRRELRVFNFLDEGRTRNRGGASRDFLVEYIVAVLKTNDVKAADGHAEALLSDFLGRNDARLLLHEVNAWLRSPYTDLAIWDRHVQYATVAASPRNVKRSGV